MCRFGILFLLFSNGVNASVGFGILPKQWLSFNSLCFDYIVIQKYISKQRTFGVSQSLHVSLKPSQIAMHSIVNRNFNAQSQMEHSAFTFSMFHFWTQTILHWKLWKKTIKNVSTWMWISFGWLFSLVFVNLPIEASFLLTEASFLLTEAIFLLIEAFISLYSFRIIAFLQLYTDKWW